MDPQAWNRYAYVTNNPLKYVDPSGHYHSGRPDCLLHIGCDDSGGNDCTGYGCGVDEPSSGNNPSGTPPPTATPTPDALPEDEEQIEYIGAQGPVCEDGSAAFRPSPRSPYSGLPDAPVQYTCNLGSGGFGWLADVGGFLFGH